eukprot:jgi/Botrbrau1/6953/Bobra.0215s0030.1
MKNQLAWLLVCLLVPTCVLSAAGNLQPGGGGISTGTPVLNQSNILIGILSSMHANITEPKLLRTWKGNVCLDRTSWFGVDCEHELVTGLNLTGAVSGGNLPVGLHMLSALKDFTCSNCNLTGTLPPEWSKLANLETLVISRSSLTGSLPDSWAELPALEYLDIGANRIEGTLPPAWVNMSSIVWLNVSRNLLQGTLPEAWVDISSLQLFDFSYNNISGTLPEVWSGMQLLTMIDGGHNNLIGTIPATWSQIPLFHYFFMTNNRLSGTLPEAWGNAGVLMMVTLTDNMITGTLPESWAHLSEFVWLDAADNSLTGTLPTSYGKMSKLSHVLLGNNSFTGSLPAAWSNLTALVELRLEHNNLTGTLPKTWASMQFLATLDLAGNSLTGTLPVDFSSLLNLTDIKLQYNHLNGTLPSEWGALSKLQHLNLAHNNLTGSLPGEEWAVNMKDLERLILRSNPLSGSLPDCWFTEGGAWPVVSLIDVRWTNISGAIPGRGGIVEPLMNMGGNRKMMFVEPLAPGHGLCGPNPYTDAQGPLFLYSQASNLKDLGDHVEDFSHVFPLPPCNPGSWRMPVALVIAVCTCVGLLVPLACLIFRRSSRIAREVEPPPDCKGHAICMQGREQLSGSKAECSKDHSSKGEGSKGPPSGKEHNITARCNFASDDGSLKPRNMSHTLKVKGLQETIACTAELSAEEIQFLTDKSGRRITIGGGSYGQVYIASWRGTDVAVKVWKEDFYPHPFFEECIPSRTKADIQKEKEHLLREALLLSQLRHPNIVNFLGYCISNDKTMVVTELCEGGDLCKAMRRTRQTKAFSWYMRGSKVALDVARGIAYLHHMGIIHYDIKPSNILLNSGGDTAKIGDIGLSKVLGSLASSSSISLRGTLQYMAPELLLGQGSSFAVDIFSFGMMLHEIITGEIPDALRGPLREPRVPEECGEDVKLLYERCVDMVPEKRPNVTDLVTELQRLQPHDFVHPALLEKE